MKMKKLLAIALVLALILCLTPAGAMADPDDPEDAGEETEEPVAETPEEDAGEPEEAPEDTEEPEDAEEPEDTEKPGEAPEEEADGPVNVEAGETWYAAPEETVYNNGGTVYNNGGVVYNNGGLAYLNDGVVYNNGGTVYANGGTVYNNGGTVYNNGALIYTFADDVENSRLYGYRKVALAEDYSAFAQVEGLVEGFLPEDGVCTVTPREGFRIIDASADAGVVTLGEDGVCTLAEPDADCTLTLRFRAEAPVLDLPAGTYAGEQTLTITAPEGTEVRYTTDGSVPDGENGEVYREPIAVDRGMTVTAVALAEGAEPSEPVSAVYALVIITAPEFEDAEEGTAPVKAVFKIENVGETDAKIKSVTLEGEDAGSFALNRGTGGTVKAGRTDESTWNIRPVRDLKKGSYTVTVVFTLEGGATAEVEVSYTVK